MDPAVKKLRDEFAIARVPTLSDLRVNKACDCTELVATGGSSGMYSGPSELLFRSVDDIIINDGVDPVKSFVLTQHGLSGSYSKEEYRYLDTGRVTPDGYLVFE